MSTGIVEVARLIRVRYNHYELLLFNWKGGILAEKPPMTDSERSQIDLLVGQAFSPSAPIKQADVFAGRRDQIRRVIDAINQAGQSILIYGERGVGKTSLANVIDEFYLSVAKARIFAPHITCDTDDTYTSIWHKVLAERDRTKATEKLSDRCVGELDNVIEDADGDITPHDIRTAAEIISQTHHFIPIIDEFDRVGDEVSIRLFTDTLKALSDHSRNTTVILVGVGDTVDDLVSEHESVERSLVQVSMQRMHATEATQILENSVSVTGVTFSGEAKKMIVAIAQGLPHYVHALGLNSVRQAAVSYSWKATTEHVENAVTKVIESSQQSLQRAYHTATSSPRPDAKHRQVLLACALAPTDTLGYFAASDVKEPISQIMGKDVNYGTFSQHLPNFSMEDRGTILQQIGPKRRFRYRFRNPLIQPFIVMHGLKDGLIDKTDIQGLFSISPNS